MATQAAAEDPFVAAMKRAFHPGAIVGALAAGVMLWLPSHEVTVAVATTLLVFVLVGGLRALDPVLTPVWDVIARVPRPLRIAVGILLPIVFSITRFGASAGSQEVERAQQSLVVSILIAYVLIRPQRSS